MRSAVAPSGRLNRLTVASAVVAGGYTTAVVAGAPSPILSLVFTVVVLALPPIAWLAFAHSSGRLRAFCGLLAAAASMWVVGSTLWYVEFVRRGQEVPDPPGHWTAFYFIAYGLAIAGAYVGLRPAIVLRRAALDLSVVVATTVALGAVVVALYVDVTVSVFDAVVVAGLPLLGLVVLTLVASAALAQWDGLPMSVVLFASGQVFLTIGSLVFSYAAAQNEYVDDRWAGMLWFVGVVISILAAVVILLGLDRPVRARPIQIPEHPMGGRSMVVAATCGLLVVVAVVAFAIVRDNVGVLIVGLAAGTWIGTALAIRASLAAREVERAYLRLDTAHLDLERAKDALEEANVELAHENVELSTLQVTFEASLAVLDERTKGRFRQLLEEAGDDLARLFSGRLGR
jgi:hypothetical protein